ncbi:uncharacterized protein LOC131935160 [Physella acuta]|uniref:uncharacterized protein LOC131935160 n=1 Tax=Physella acuta TaxID=109671 RepID=UPI0027DE8E50|nr:uncharacterized protein LOC131935160 [Physella acuta]XP_059147508.1 uncharacterized protein LOC131935160 [Physella acuta]XP_059147509.1 uncharacterized protein LOC131935160 [Physella acuta]
MAAILVMTFVVWLLAHKVQGHGRLLEPPSRASMWRMGFNTPPNYDDNQLFCGGVKVQYEDNGGKCGVCGDPWQGPLEHEPGGKYATGTIVRKYNVNDVMLVVVEITANHRGYVEFRLCPSDDPMAKITQDCLDKYVLKNTTGASRFAVPEGDYLTRLFINVTLRIPTGLRCRACMIQWKYNAGNSWGTFPNGTSCVGCGNQEQFYGCSDIAIGYDDVVLGVTAKPNYVIPDMTTNGVKTNDSMPCEYADILGPCHACCTRVHVWLIGAAVLFALRLCVM